MTIKTPIVWQSINGVNHAGYAGENETLCGQIPEPGPGWTSWERMPGTWAIVTCGRCKRRPGWKRMYGGVMP